MAETLGVSRKTLSKIINERGSITPDMALRLSRAFDTTPAFWLNLQKNYDLWQAETHSKEWKKVKPFLQQILHAKEIALCIRCKQINRLSPSGSEDG